MTEQLSDTITELLAKTPEWVRQGLLSKEPGLRTRAEEALAAMIAAAVADQGIMSARAVPPWPAASAAPVPPSPARPHRLR